MLCVVLLLLLSFRFHPLVSWLFPPASCVRYGGSITTSS
jgi:hypothetical protein